MSTPTTGAIAVMLGYTGPPPTVDQTKVEIIKSLYVAAVLAEDWAGVEAYEKVLCLLHGIEYDPSFRHVVQIRATS